MEAKGKTGLAKSNSQVILGGRGGTPFANHNARGAFRNRLNPRNLQYYTNLIAEKAKQEMA